MERRDGAQGMIEAFSDNMLILSTMFLYECDSQYGKKSVSAAVVLCKCSSTLGALIVFQSFFKIEFRDQSRHSERHQIRKSSKTEGRTNTPREANRRSLCCSRSFNLIKSKESFLCNHFRVLFRSLISFSVRTHARRGDV